MNETFEGLLVDLDDELSRLVAGDDRDPTVTRHVGVRLAALLQADRHRAKTSRFRPRESRVSRVEAARKLVPVKLVEIHRRKAGDHDHLHSLKRLYAAIVRRIRQLRARSGGAPSRGRE